MPGSAVPGEIVLLGTVGRNGIPADRVAAAGSATGVAIELTGDGVGTTAATVRLGDALLRAMPTIAMMHRVTKAQGSTLCDVGLAVFLRLLAFRIKILRPEASFWFREELASDNGPTEAYFYKRWLLPDIEQVK
jgi:hypothetical protein